jgi:ElaB/YqjD/DUF883 family membrane-anchored ribosome-binding protein
MLKPRPNILERLATADRLHQREVGGCLLFRSIKFLCAFLLLAFVIDLIWHLPPSGRLALVLALIALAGAIVLTSWYVASIRRHRLERIARFLENRAPTLGSQLINLLQLRAQAKDTTLPPLTRDLARQAVENYAGQLQSAPLEHLARTGALPRHAWHALFAVLAFVALLAVFHRVSAIQLARFFDPYGDHPPYSFTRLEIVDPGPAGTNVLYGQSVVVRVRTAGHQPRELFLTSHPPDHPELAVTVPMFDKGRTGFDQRLEDVRTELVAYAHTKNQASRSKQSRIGVILTPQVEASLVRIAPPPYTGIAAEEKPFHFKTVQALAGSEVRFRLRSNRPLRGGQLTVSMIDQPDLPITLTNLTESEVAGSFVAAHSARLHFSVTDITGILSTGEHQGSLTVTYDLPPSIRVAEPDRDTFVAMDFKLQARFEAQDDYGLSRVRIHRGINGEYPDPFVTTYDSVVRQTTETLDLDLPALGVQSGDIVSLFAEAADTAPSPQLALSQTVRLRVISVEEYNDFLREQTDLADTEAKYLSLMDDLQELVEEQKQLAETANPLQEQLAQADPSQREALQRAFDALLARQSELNQKLEQHARRLENFVRDQPLYDVEKELQKELQQLAQQIRDSTAANQAATQALAPNPNPNANPNSPSGQSSLSPDALAAFQKAAEQQVAQLDQVQSDTQEQVADVLADLSQMQDLVKGFNLFETLYQAQQEITAQAQAYQRPGELSREDQLALKELAGVEKEIGDALQLLERQLREDAAEAKELFPKAAQSAVRLADQIDSLRLATLARQATSRMLAGEGEPSYLAAERLRDEMETLFQDCQGGHCPSSGELDSYLSLQRGLNPGNNFSQLSRSRKFSFSSRPGFAFGQGQGASGSSGYAVSDPSKINVLGNEFAPSRGQASARQSSRQGRGTTDPSAVSTAEHLDPADVVAGLNPIQRPSGAVATETLIEEYSAVVDRYFEAITTRTPQAP